MTELIRYSPLGREDRRVGTGSFTVTLGDGRVVTLSELDIGQILAEVTGLKGYTLTELNARTPTAGLFARVTDDVRGVWMGNGSIWTKRAPVNVLDFVTGGAGTSGNPWTSATGTGGWQEAINGLGTNPGQVYGPAGYYSVASARITIRRSGIQLIGEGHGTILQWSGTPPAGAFGGTQGMITIYPNDAVYPATPGTQLVNNAIIGLHLIGLNEAVYTAGRQGIEVENCSGCVIAHNYLEDFGAENILLGAAFGTAGQDVGTLVASNEVKGGGNGINTGNSARYRVIGNYIHDTEFQQGIELATPSVSPDVTNLGGVVSDNVIYNTPNSGILVSDGFGITIHDNILIRTLQTADAASGGAIAINDNSSPGMLMAVKAQGNFIYDVGGLTGIAVSAANASNRIEVADNSISRVGTLSSGTGSGINLSNTGHVLLHGNVVTPGAAPNRQLIGITSDANAVGRMWDNMVYAHTNNNYDVNNANMIVGVNFDDIRTTVRSGFARKRTAPTYGTTVSINAALGDEFDINVTNATAFTVANPTNSIDGQRISIQIRNATGSPIGAVTWDTAYKLAAWTQPAANTNRTIDFQYNGTNWVEVSRTTVDVPN